MNVPNYQVFGLQIQSEIDLPELFPANGPCAPDVTIRRGKVKTNGGEPGVRGEDDALVLTIPAVGRYRITGGREIVVDADSAIPERNVRLFLLGSAFGALLHQRGLLPLHANAIDVDGRAVAFMGESGAGKSTLAAWFYDRGFQVIADDVCVVRFDTDRILAYPGLPRLRLWAEVLRATGREPAAFSRSYVDAVGHEKYDVPVHDNALREARPLAAIVILARGENFSMERVTDVEAVEAIFHHTYRGRYLDQIASHQDHWSAAVRVVRNVPIYRLTRAWAIDLLDEQCELVLDFVRSRTIREE